MAGKNCWSLLNEPALVFNGIDAANAYKKFTPHDGGESSASSRPVIRFINLKRYAMWLDDDPLGGMSFAKQSRLILVASEDCVSINKKPVRFKKQAEKLAPFPPFIGRGIE